MKIQLSKEKDINILTVTEAIDAKSFAVLKAGITKLFRDGKNRIILEIVECATLDSAILREISFLNVLARELAGDIVLAGVDPATKAKIANFAKPPIVFCFATRAEAIKHFEPKPAAPLTAPTRATAAVAPASVTGTAAPAVDEKAKKDEVLALKEKLLEKEAGELAQLRTELEKLRADNQQLTENLAKMLIERREPADVATYSEKIKSLEAELEVSIAKIRELEKG